MRRALTTWKTSTTPSVLHISMAFTTEQNTPTLLTVSLCVRIINNYIIQSLINYILSVANVQGVYEIDEVYGDIYYYLEWKFNANLAN